MVFPYWDMDPNPGANIPLENMIVAMFAPRAEIITKAHDPQRLEGVMQEWAIFYWLTLSMKHLHDW